MNTKPEALRLADELEMWTLGEPAAAELRRLHEVIQRLLRERNISLEAGQRDTARIAELEKQRDELLEALRFVADIDLRDTDLTVAGHMAHCMVGKSREALSKAEGKQ